MAGRFIVVEGGDGAGKTSLVAALAGALAGLGKNILVTREPGGTAEGMALRALLLADNATQWDPCAELLLMIAARVQHVRRVIRPALEGGRMVLCDRFVGSTLAYQGGGRGIDPGLILALHRDLVEDLWPDMTLLLDIDPALGLARSRARLAAQGVAEGRFEALDLMFHQRVRAVFRSLAELQPGWVTIDAAAPFDDAVAAAVKAVGGEPRFLLPAQTGV